ncbi:MAG: hypothetical protein EBR82_61975, partial [Caulobacteraceae bacterium]|nr:hypothetical protein [Caulobacteraceae bacterium]
MSTDRRASSSAGAAQSADAFGPLGGGELAGEVDGDVGAGSWAPGIEARWLMLGMDGLLGVGKAGEAAVAVADGWLDQQGPRPERVSPGRKLRADHGGGFEQIGFGARHADLRREDRSEVADVLRADRCGVECGAER